MTYESMLAKSNQLASEISALQSQLKAFPSGHLTCTRNGKHYKWYQSDGHTSVYIPKKNRQLAEQLAAKKYLTLQLKNLIHEKNAIDHYLKHHAAHPNTAEQMLLDHSKYHELLSPFFKPHSQELLDWMTFPFEKNMKYPEQLTHKTPSGNLVRSKSEALIDMSLYINKIPFRYECALQLGDVTLYPDFTILHPQTSQIFYWEHFGQMDQPSYAKNVSSKLQLYTSNGLIPTIHLITTYQTKEFPLTTEKISQVIQNYFL